MLVYHGAEADACARQPIQHIWVGCIYDELHLITDAQFSRQHVQVLDARRVTDIAAPTDEDKPHSRRAGSSVFGIEFQELMERIQLGRVVLLRPATC